MRRVWDALAIVVVTLFAIKLLFDYLKPYMPFMALALVLYVIGAKAYRNARRW